MNVDRDRNMALKPSYNDKLYLPGLSNTEILILALEASQKLEWNIEEVTPEGIRLEVPFSIRSHGEAITFTIEKGSDGEVSVRSLLPYNLLIMERTEKISRSYGKQWKK